MRAARKSSTRPAPNVSACMACPPMAQYRNARVRAACVAVRPRASRTTTLPDKPARGVHQMRMPIQLLALLYFLAYIPYAVITRWFATIPYPPLGRALTGLEILPAATLLSGVFTFLFAWLSGWWRRAHRLDFNGLSLPVPTRWTALSGIGTAMLLFTVPLSFTFKGVSIPFMQLLMRGDVLIIAPLVDLISGRRVRWFSWLALVLVAIGL